MRRVVAVIGIVAALGLAGCSGEPRAQDLPPDVLAARPSITAEEASFVLAAEDLGVHVTGASVEDDIEIGTTTCWALKQGGLTLADIARDAAGKPLPDSGDGLRTKRLMAAAVQALCPDYSDQRDQLHLPDR